MHIIKSLKLTLTLVMTLSAVVFASAEEPSTSRISVSRGERWWGFHMGDAQNEPAPVVLAQGQESQELVALMMISSKGRYIYNDLPMMISFDGSTLNITAEGEKIEVNKSHTAEKVGVSSLRLYEAHNPEAKSHNAGELSTSHKRSNIEAE